MDLGRGVCAADLRRRLGTEALVLQFDYFENFDVPATLGSAHNGEFRRGRQRALRHVDREDLRAAGPALRRRNVGLVVPEALQLYEKLTLHRGAVGVLAKRPLVVS